MPVYIKHANIRRSVKATTTKQQPQKQQCEHSHCECQSKVQTPFQRQESKVQFQCNARVFCSRRPACCASHSSPISHSLSVTMLFVFFPLSAAVAKSNASVCSLPLSSVLFLAALTPRSQQHLCFCLLCFVYLSEQL